MNNKYILLLLCAAFLYSCSTEFNTEENFDLELLPGYVAFNAAGNSVNLADVEVAEDGGVATVNIECPTGTLSDITVNYEFGGDAVFGTDFTVSGATATGGSIILNQDPTDVVFRSNVDLDIELLMDGVADGTKTLTITLTSASNAEGAVAVGRGGTDFLKTATVVIADID